MTRPKEYGYELVTARNGWGHVQVLGTVVTVYSPSHAWPRCMNCDSLSCSHLQEMYNRANVQMPDAVFD